MKSQKNASDLKKFSRKSATAGHAASHEPIEIGPIAPPVFGASLKREGAEKKTKRPLGSSSRILVSLRLTRKQWEAIHGFAKSEGVSLQGLAISGIASLFERRGLIKDAKSLLQP